MRQRVMIAIGLACGPRVLIADEPTTALDVTVQAQIFDLLIDLKERTGTSIILITHDMGAIAEMAERVVVMYAGRIVEEGPVEVILGDPLHPYTRGLITCVPHLEERPSPERRPLTEIAGMVPALTALGRGCAFAPRCDHAMDRCREQAPTARRRADVHRVACWLHEGPGAVPGPGHAQAAGRGRREGRRLAPCSLERIPEGGGSPPPDAGQGFDRPAGRLAQRHVRHEIRVRDARGMSDYAFGQSRPTDCQRSHGAALSRTRAAVVRLPLVAAGPMSETMLQVRRPSGSLQAAAPGAVGAALQRARGGRDLVRGAAGHHLRAGRRERLGQVDDRARGDAAGRDHGRSASGSETPC